LPREKKPAYLLKELFKQMYQNFYDKPYPGIINDDVIFMRNLNQLLGKATKDEIEAGINRFYELNANHGYGYFLYWFRECFINDYRVRQEKEKAQSQKQSQIEKVIAECQSRKTENWKRPSFRHSLTNTTTQSQ
jgi:hypothetical protein